MHAIRSTSAFRTALSHRVAASRALPASFNAFSRRTFSQTSVACSSGAQSTSALGPIGVQAAVRAASDPSFTPRATLLEKEFSVAGRVAIVSGGQRGLGLEMAEALAEAGAIVYCLDLPATPDATFKATQAYVSKLALGAARLEYAAVDVTDQTALWGAVAQIAEREGRMDICVANAGILRSADALEYPQADFEALIRVNVCGALYAAQAAGRQMVKYGKQGSIVLLASMAGSVALEGQTTVAYNTSKGAVVQMARSLACELAPKGIRVNSLSPGYIPTTMTLNFMDAEPKLWKEWASQNPLGRLGRPDELRGAVTWLASDASTFCTGSDIIVSGGHHAW